MATRKVGRQESLKHQRLTEDQDAVASYVAVANHFHGYWPDGHIWSLTHPKRRKPFEELFFEDLYDLLEPLKEAIERGTASRQSVLYQSLWKLLGNLLPSAMRSREEFLTTCKTQQWRLIAFKDEEFHSFLRLVHEFERGGGRTISGDGIVGGAFVQRQRKIAEFRKLGPILQETLRESWTKLAERRAIADLVTKFNREKSSRSAKQRALKELRVLGFVKREPGRNQYGVYSEPIPTPERDA